METVEVSFDRMGEATKSTGLTVVLEPPKHLGCNP
jgi:hypothetical protein